MARQTATVNVCILGASKLRELERQVASLARRQHAARRARIDAARVLAERLRRMPRAKVHTADARAMRVALRILRGAT